MASTVCPSNAASAAALGLGAGFEVLVAGRWPRLVAGSG